MTRAAGTSTMLASGSLDNYRNAHRSISEGLRSVLPQAAGVTGQVNWDTITTVPTTTVTAVRDFDVFAFTDTLQATKPIFVRVDYAINVSNPSPQITVGTTVDSAGVIGGVTTGKIRMENATTSTTTAHNWWCSSDGSYLTFFGGVDLAGTGVGAYTRGFVLDRTRNLDGTPNGEGYVLLTWAERFNSTLMRYTNAYSSQQPAAELSVPTLVPALAGSSSAFFGDTAYAYPVYPYAPLTQAASAAVLLSWPTDMPRGSEITLPLYGSDRKWLALGSAATVPVPYVNAITSATAATGFTKMLAPIIRWE